MPIEYIIDHAHRVVRAKAIGSMTEAEVFEYQRKAWSRPEVAGYNEIMDVSALETMPAVSPDRMYDLASLSAWMDHLGKPSRFAIVAPQDFAFQSAQMYETLRASKPLSRKQVKVFRSLAEALAWLEVPPEKGEATGVKQSD